MLHELWMLNMGLMCLLKVTGALTMCLGVIDLMLLVYVMNSSSLQLFRVILGIPYRITASGIGNPMAINRDLSRVVDCIFGQLVSFQVLTQFLGGSLVRSESHYNLTTKVACCYIGIVQVLSKPRPYPQLLFGSKSLSRAVSPLFLGRSQWVLPFCARFRQISPNRLVRIDQPTDNRQLSVQCSCQTRQLMVMVGLL